MAGQDFGQIPLDQSVFIARASLLSYEGPLVAQVWNEGNNHILKLLKCSYGKTAQYDDYC